MAKWICRYGHGHSGHTGYYVHDSYFSVSLVPIRVSIWILNICLKKIYHFTTKNWKVCLCVLNSSQLICWNQPLGKLRCPACCNWESCCKSKLCVRCTLPCDRICPTCPNPIRNLPKKGKTLNTNTIVFHKLKSFQDKKHTMMHNYINSFQKIPKLQKESVAMLLLLNVCLVPQEWKSMSIAHKIRKQTAVKEVNISMFVSSY